MDHRRPGSSPDPPSPACPPPETSRPVTNKTDGRPDQDLGVEERRTGLPKAAAGAGAGALMVLCCAGPTLVAAGVLGSVGSFLGNPLVIATGVLLAVAAVVIVVPQMSLPRRQLPHQERNLMPTKIDRHHVQRLVAPAELAPQRLDPSRAMITYCYASPRPTTTSAPRWTGSATACPSKAPWPNSPACRPSPILTCPLAVSTRPSPRSATGSAAGGWPWS